MDNRGKLWSIDDDQKLMESPHLPNAYFSQTMGRSENAIKMRRSHLAAKMYQNDQSTSLEEFVGLMHADLDHSAALLHEWNEKRASLKSFMDITRKRKSREMLQPTPDPPAPPVRSPFFQQPRSSAPDPPPRADDHGWHSLHWPSASLEDKIAAICKSINEEGGNLSSVFNDPQFLPCLVQHYPGFEAYARIVQARGAQLPQK